MHIRSLADADSTHSGAAYSTIEVMVAHECWKRGPGAVETQILGNAVLFSQRRGPGLSGSISVLDWTTGNMTFVSVVFGGPELLDEPIHNPSVSLPCTRRLVLHLSLRK